MTSHLKLERLQPLFIPLNSLQEGRLFRVLGNLVAKVPSDRKAMLNTGVKVDLVWLANLLEKDLGVMSLLGWENGISLSGGDGVWSLDSFQLVVFDKRRMCRIADIDDSGLEKAHNIFGTEAVAGSTNFLFTKSAVESLEIELTYLDTILLSHGFDALLDDRIHDWW